MDISEPQLVVPFWRKSALDMKRNKLVSSIFLGIILLTLYHIFSLRGLYADGNIFFLRIIELSSFWDFDRARKFVQLITQAPLVMGLWLGVIDIGHLSLLHSLGLFLFPSLFWLLALNRLKSEIHFWPFFLVYILVVMNSGYFAIGEYNLAYAMVGYSFAVLISKHKIDIIGGILLVLVAGLLILAYESLAFLGVLLFTAGLGRVHYHKKDGRLEFIWIYPAIFFYFCAAAMASWSILHPRAPANLHQAIAGLFLLAENKQLLISTLVGILYFYVMFFHPSRYSRLIAITTAISSTLFLFFPSLWSQPDHHYEARILVGLSMFSFLFFILLASHLSPISNYIISANEKAIKREIWIIPCLLFFTTSVADLYYTHQYAKFIHESKSTLLSIDKEKNET